jgi:hypothetical protein
MKIAAELIQASNNIATNVPIYTFLLTYPRRSIWTFLANWFPSLFAERLMVRRYVTATHNILIDVDAAFSVYESLRDQVQVRRDFASYIFGAVANGGRISGADVKKAIDLFGPNFQNVLKQYKPGEMHLPCGMSADHAYVAIEESPSWFEVEDRGYYCG